MACRAKECHHGWPRNDNLLGCRVRAGVLNDLADLGHVLHYGRDDAASRSAHAPVAFDREAKAVDDHDSGDSGAGARDFFDFGV